MTGAVRLTGRITVGLPPAEAFALFTPRGEAQWAHGWHPRFVVATPDDAAPGTVFVTDAHGQHTTWVVASCERGRQICYARVTPGDWAGLVSIVVQPAKAGSDADVSYDLTALSDDGAVRLAQFAAGYAGYLESWESAISTAVSARDQAGRLN